VGAAGSAFEHAVPERLFADPSKPLDDPSQPQGISAVKALAIAASQGQRIYTLNQQNQAYHASIVAGLNTDAETKAEITNALNAGMEVTVHQGDITANGWTGSGYIILDPETGAGAYKISGGANGGSLYFAKGMLTFVGVIIFFTGTAEVATALLTVLTILTVFVAMYSVLLNAIEIVDTGGACGPLLAERYLQFWVPLTLASIGLTMYFGGKTAEAIMLKLMAIMYGGDLFKGVGSSKACHL
jgi:hypothetical protein